MAWRISCVGGAGVAVEQGLGGQHDARRAEAALRAAVLDERLLDGMQRRRRRQALDGDDVAARRFQRQHQAGVDGSAVDQHRAGAAVAVAATFLGAGEADAVAQQLEQRVARVGEHRALLAVDGAGEERLHARADSIAAAAQQSASARAVSTATSERR